MAKVKELRYVCNITGEGITTDWDVYGTDLGIPVYSEAQKKMYFLFGDTFGAGNPDDPSKGKNWRGTIAGYTSDLDFTNGIKWEGFLDDANGDARQLVPAHYTPNDAKIERTKICQGGIEVNGALYFFYESIRYWGPHASGIWFLNFGGTIKSTDGGKTFSKLYDLTWIEPTDEEGIKVARDLTLEDMSFVPARGVEFDAKAHVAPGFGQMYATDGKDGYIYVYGRPGGRKKGIKVGRVKKENIESFAAYEYLTEFDGDKAVWKPFREGLDAIIANPEKADVIPAPTSNMSVQYNEYLGKWMLIYFYPGGEGSYFEADEKPCGIYYSLGDTPYGPFTTPELVLPYNHPELTRELPGAINKNGLYGGFTHEKMYREGGKIVPIIISQWHDRVGLPRIYGSRLFEIEFE